MAGIVDMSEAEDGQGLDVEVDWVGFEKEERGVFAFTEDFRYQAPTYWCLLHCQGCLISFFVVTEHRECCRVGHML